MKDLALERYDEACAHGRAGRETEAIPCYQEALSLGLPDPLRRQALLGLGSLFRNVLRQANAIGLLRDAAAEHPDDAAIGWLQLLEHAGFDAKLVPGDPDDEDAEQPVFIGVRPAA